MGAARLPSPTETAQAWRDAPPAEKQRALNELAGAVHAIARDELSRTRLSADLVDELAWEVTARAVASIQAGTATLGRESQWVRVAARYAARSELRRQSRYVAREEGPPPSSRGGGPPTRPTTALDVPDSSPSPEEALSRSWVARFVTAALAEAPPRFREILLDVYVREMPIDAIVEFELADQGESPSDVQARERARNRVSQRLHRARLWMRAHIEETLEAWGEPSNSGARLANVLGLPSGERTFSLLQKLMIPLVREEPAVYLNFWFPNVFLSIRHLYLTVGHPARLLVNLGSTARPRGGSSQLGEEARKLLAEQPFIDVAVLCPGASVSPLRQRLRLPPDPAAALQFTITPRVAARLTAEILLLIRNQPVHRSSFGFSALDDSEAATADGAA